MENGLEKLIEQLLFEIRWIEKNMNPPVNYALIITISVITSVITMVIACHL